MNLNDNPRNATMCFSKAGLAEGTNANTIKIAAPNGAGVDYSIKGIMYHAADADNIAMTALAQQAVLTTCLYLVCLDSSGNLSITKGTEVLKAKYDAGDAVLDWPVVPDNKCAIGAFKIDLASTATFTCGSVDLGAANVTDTYFDLSTVPSIPLSA